VEDMLETYTDTKFEPKVVHLFAICYLGKELPVVNPDVDHADAQWWPIQRAFPEMLYPYQATVLAEFAEAYVVSKNNNQL
jgi:hypothetical protein